MPEEKTKEKPKEDYKMNLEKIYGSEVLDYQEKFASRSEVGSKAMEKLKNFMDEYKSTSEKMNSTLKEYGPYMKEADKIRKDSMGKVKGLLSWIPGADRILGNYLKPDSIHDVLQSQMKVMQEHGVALNETISEVKRQRDDSDNVLERLFDLNTAKIEERDLLEVELVTLSESDLQYMQKLEEARVKNPTGRETIELEKEYSAFHKDLMQKKSRFGTLSTAINFTINLQGAYRVLVEGLDTQIYMGDGILEKYTMELESMQEAIKTQRSLTEVQEAFNTTLGLWSLLKENANTALDIVSRGSKVIAELSDKIMDEHLYDPTILENARKNFKDARDIVDRAGIDAYEKSKGKKKDEDKNYTPKQ